MKLLIIKTENTFKVMNYVDAWAEISAHGRKFLVTRMGERYDLHTGPSYEVDLGPDLAPQGFRRLT